MKDFVISSNLYAKYIVAYKASTKLIYLERVYIKIRDISNI